MDDLVPATGRVADRAFISSICAGSTESYIPLSSSSSSSIDSDGIGGMGCDTWVWSGEV